MRAAGRYVATAVAVAAFCAIALVLLNAHMRKGLSHDEHMYVVAGALVAQGLLPYRDFPYLQMPYLSFVYALLPEHDGHFLLTARLFSTLCVWLLLGLVFVTGWRLFEGRSHALRLLVPAGAGLLLATNPVFIYTAGLAWNHDLPVLLAVGAFLVHCRAARGQGYASGVIVSGALLGLAVGTRLSFAALLLPFVLALLLSPNPVSWVERVKGLARHLLGFAGALVPALLLFAAAPERFLFGNLDYHNLNALYWRSLGYERAMNIPGKLAYLGEVAREPGTLALLLAFLAVALTLAVPKARSGYLFELSFAGGSTVALLVVALAPSPTWYQYYYAPLPFLALGLLYGLASLTSRSQPGLLFPQLALFTLAVGVALFNGLPAYYKLGALEPPGSWTPLETRKAGTRIAGAVGGGKVLTLSPLFPLEGGADIYSALATGPFTWRSAPLMMAEERREEGVVSADELAAFLADDPPDGILVGQEGTLDNPLAQFGRENGYEERRLEGGLTLWLPSGR